MPTFPVAQPAVTALPPVFALNPLARPLSQSMTAFADWTSESPPTSAQPADRFLLSHDVRGDPVGPAVPVTVPADVDPDGLADRARVVVNRIRRLWRRMGHAGEKRRHQDRRKKTARQT